jgi:hypothetical protein
MIDEKVRHLATEGGLNEIQRGYVRQLLDADAKGESGTIALLGASRKVADCLAVVLAEDAAKPPNERRLPQWEPGEIPPRVVRPAVTAGLEILRRIGAAAQQGQPYFKFQGGLDVTRSTLAQTRRYTRELVEAHPEPAVDGAEDPRATLDALYNAAAPPLETLRKKAEAERQLRWAALGPGRAP